MGRYVDPAEQLVTELVVADVRRSAAFYRDLGFEQLRDDGNFLELSWEGHRLFLLAASAAHPVAAQARRAESPHPIANVRVMVPDVEGCWRRAGEIGARVVSPIADRYYGLRDFTIADPDGFGVRFASSLRGDVTTRTPAERHGEGGGPIRILGICGSLRAASSNGNLIQALGALVPDGVEVSVYQGLGDLPAFNPDIEEAVLPAVAALRTSLSAADGVVISSPEYAHGVPGALKNALDWVVGTGELVDKPVALINTSPRSTYAYASLYETLTVMSARVLDEASPVVPLAGKSLDATGLASHPELSPLLRAALRALAQACAARRAERVDE